MADSKNLANANQAIEHYIQRVTELSQLGQKIPTNQDLLKIASELGISDEEIQSAQRQSQAHFIRAQGYSSLRHWDDAIEELQEALAFNPFNLPMLHLLINSYLGRWKDKHNSQDEEQIRIRVKQCLEIQPDDQESLNLLAQLDKLIISYKYQLWGLGALGLLVIGSLTGFLFLNNMSFNLFSENDKKIENIKNELINEIGELKDEQVLLYNQLLQQIKEQGSIDNNMQLEIEILKKEIKQLNEQHQELIKKITQSNKENLPVTPTPNNPPQTNNKTETKSP
ncbi:hypothetical protein [Geminocystis sp. NIES-3709]|uniref:hypothetical protein n=1 Tax=Geminocystis sp. NIES-3709 TaxID=1617448 RepID=UPI0005FC648F|nr:hypothetical protein [Geminocystis sp. NIES-3709]BAQ64545.1 hypothetical protein GM3709_1310 [Geminocystis sp. NIES-3709]